MEPDDIATLSLTLCLDMAITLPLEEGGWSWGEWSYTSKGDLPHVLCGWYGVG